MLGSPLLDGAFPVAVALARSPSYQKIPEPHQGHGELGIELDGPAEQRDRGGWIRCARFLRLLKQLQRFPTGAGDVLWELL
jgi:hypothetical protein